MIYCPIYQVEEESATREAVDLIGDQIDGGTVTPPVPHPGERVHRKNYLSIIDSRDRETHRPQLSGLATEATERHVYYVRGTGDELHSPFLRRGTKYCVLCNSPRALGSGLRLALGEPWRVRPVLPRRAVRPSWVSVVLPFLAGRARPRPFTQN